MYFEINFDGLVGPTHNYSGLSVGNLASTRHGAQRSNPQQAALQGLQKMKALNDLGIPQAVLPPHERPHLATLRAIGFSGSDAEIISYVAKRHPEILRAASSASAMWVANAATTSASCDSNDGRVHFTPANLVAKWHRSVEPEQTGAFLRKIFPSPEHFAHHAPLPSHVEWGDEGAANHTRLCDPESGRNGLHLFVYGKEGFGPGRIAPKKFPARQTLAASQAVARLHRLSDTQLIAAQQLPRSIDAGVFHNDVISVGNEDVFFYHELAFVGGEKTPQLLRRRYRQLTGKALHLIKVSQRQVSLADTVKSYLFNTQLVRPPGSERMTLIAPIECQEIRSVKQYLQGILEQNSSPIEAVRYFDLRQSMRNGGGPACLRFRVVLNEAEREAMHQPVCFNDDLFTRLCSWVKRYYRDRLETKDLADPKLYKESCEALQALTNILQLGSIYPFQRSVV